MKDIALKKRFKFGGQSRTAANIICSEELTSSKRDKSASRFSVESTLSYLKKELSELMGPDYSPKDKVLASDLRLPKDMSADLKNEYINSVRSMILDIESVQRRLGIRPK